MKNFLKIALSVLCMFTFQQIKAQETPAYKNSKLPFETRVNDLISRMTLDEKIAQMQNEAVAIPRLDIPYYNWSGECLHGIVNEGSNATVFPQAIGMAATWNPDLIGQEADVISTEARAWYYLCLKNNDVKGVHKGLTFWSPNINIFRDPRWGRGQETYGEDPFLTARIAVSFVKGLQGNDARYFKLISTPKHYAVHSGPEPLRHKFDAVATKRDVFETYLPAFEACIREAGAFSVMGAYSSYLNTPCCASKFLLNDILRKKWGFGGYVVSDCGAIDDIWVGHSYVNSQAKAAAAAVKAGCDITCGTEYNALKEAIEKGFITEKEMDVSLSRLMLARMKLGMFDPPAMNPYSNIAASEIESPEHRKLALKVAHQSIVLLKNQNHFLPLNANTIKSIAVIGPYIQRDDVLYGNYNGISKQPVTFLKGIKNKVGDKIKIEFTRGVKPYDEGGALTTVPAEYLKTADGKRGLIGEYFDNAELIGKPVFIQVDTNMEFYWDKNSPAPNVPADNFSVRWTGTITPPESGNYDLGVVSDDRSRLYFENKLLIDNWRPYEMNVMKTTKVRMEKGKEYKVQMEFADSVDFAGIRFRWKKDNSEQELESNESMLNKAISITKAADVAIVFAGISANIEGEEMSINLKCFKGGDRVCLDLPEEQQALLQALKATGKPIVLVLTSGSALSLNWENANLPSIVEAWYPGEEGGTAVADVLFGDYNPGGRLPVTFYKSANDLPDFSNYNMEGRTYRYFRGSPLYPFGYGLSYTRFDYSNLVLSKTEIHKNENITISTSIKNSGNYDGDEVVQMYVKHLNSKQPQAIKSLRGFKRINVLKGTSATVEFTLKPDDLKFFDENKDDYTIEAGEYEIQIGASSDDIKLKGKLILKD
ncbi:MAG: glycoside hydrolase family 3 C-terminal domain-containing protein [Bacteroidota bacterium]